MDPRSWCMTGQTTQRPPLRSVVRAGWLKRGVGAARVAVGAVTALAALTAAPPAFAQAAAPAAGEQELQSCVEGSPPMRVAMAAERAVLDAADRKRFHDAAATRYPLYQRSGLVPTHVLLLRRGGRWQYVTLGPRGAGDLCFVAVFAAERFDFTPDWVRKYQPKPAESMD